MENSPETKPNCDCACSCKKSAAPVIVVLLIAVIAVVAAIFIFSNKPLPQYAPEGTDAIVAVNGRGICRTKVFQAFRKTLAYENMAAEAAYRGIHLDQALYGEACLFVDSSEDTTTLSMIYRARGGVAEKLFSYIKKLEQDDFEMAKAAFEESKKQAEKQGGEFTAKAPECSTDKIDGKEAVISRRGDTGVGDAFILLDNNTIQCSFGSDKQVFVPLKAAKTNELGKAIDPEALISVVCKFELPKWDWARKSLESEKAAKYRDLHTDLDMVKLNIYDVGEDIEFKLTAEYKSAEAAEKAAKQLNDQYREAEAIGDKLAAAENAPAELKEAVAVLKAIKIEAQGKQVVVTLKYNQDKIVKLIEDQDKKDRAEKQEIEKQIMQIEAK